MRWVVTSLVLINIAVFGWYQWVGTTAAPEQTAHGLPEVTYNNLRSGGQPELAAAPSLSALRQQDDERADTCAFIGSFASDDAVNTAQRRLQSLEISTRIESVEIPDEPLWWVYVPPASSASEAQRQLARLSERQIESFLVTQGEFANAISLGYFRSRSNAVGLNEQYNAEGIESSVREIQRFNNRFWLVAEPEAASLVGESSLRALREATPDIELRRDRCDWLQNS